MPNLHLLYACKPVLSIPLLHLFENHQRLLYLYPLWVYFGSTNFITYLLLKFRVCLYRQTDLKYRGDLKSKTADNLP